MRIACLLVCLVAMSVPVAAQQMSDDNQIRAVMVKQASDWNHGNLAAFATGYKKSPDIVFMGKEIHHGYDDMLAGYRKNYPTRGKMGALIYSDLQVDVLDAKYATVLGKFKLERLAADGGDAEGYFSLVFEKTFDGWKIILDHTTSTTEKK